MLPTPIKTTFADYRNRASAWLAVPHPTLIVVALALSIGVLVWNGKALLDRFRDAAHDGAQAEQAEQMKADEARSREHEDAARALRQQVAELENDKIEIRKRLEAGDRRLTGLERSRHEVYRKLEEATRLIGADASVADRCTDLCARARRLYGLEDCDCK